MRPTILALTLLAACGLTACGPTVRHGTVNGLSYDVAGTGPVVVLIPDSAGRLVWAQQFKVLAKSFEVVQYEPFGTVTDLTALMDHLGVTKASIVALGAGVTPALDLTLTQPERVESLVLVSPHMGNEHTPFVAIKPPVLLVVGTKDDSAAELGLDTIRAHLGGVETITMPGASHLVNADRAKSFNTALQEFLFHVHPEAMPRHS
jgi:pimeloyl-ACP methyl ester carboxylesterase